MAEARALILQGHNRPDIAEALGSLFPGTNPMELIHSALADIKTRSTVPIDSTQQFTKEAALQLYQRLNSVGDYNGALKALAFWHEVASEETVAIDI